MNVISIRSAMQIDRQGNSVMLRSAPCYLAYLACLLIFGAHLVFDACHPLHAQDAAAVGDGVFVRFKVVKPYDGKYYVRLGGYIHVPNWYLPAAVIPAGADKDAAKRLDAGQFTEWFDLKTHAGKLLHGRLSRAGGVAELPNVTATFVTDEKSDGVSVVIELATAPDERQLVKRFEENFPGNVTSFLVSPRLRADVESLETAAEMTERRLQWAREASGGKRVSPRQLIVQTSLWAPQRPDLNVREGEVLWLLGFNVVGNQFPEIRDKFHFRDPGHSHGTLLGPAATRESIDEQMKKDAARFPNGFDAGVPFGFSDEVVCRPAIGTDPAATAHFHQWLAAEKIAPASLGVKQLTDVVPIETPEVFREREKENGPAARRVFYYTSRFRQRAATERLKWNTEAFHRHFPPGPITSTLVADHPYFSGTGLGMGMTPNAAWGGAPLAMDWFDLARHKAVDLIGVEDWMGLQYMYGPDYTWEGFQLMGFQASIMRSGSGGTQPIIAWITPSDETNLRLKSSSALCQGAKHFFYWTYGPTATSTENYWSDLRGAYDGVVNMTRNLAAAEHIIAPGQTRKTRVALLYSLSSDLWQPTGYVHMLERRATYLSLVHDQYLVDMLTEQDIEAGRLGNYDVLYATDPCITTAAAAKIAAWVKTGGHLYGSCASGSRNEFNEPSPGLAPVFGIEADVKVDVQPGRYHVRGALNYTDYTDEIRVKESDPDGELATLGVIGARVSFRPTTATTTGTFKDGSPAIVRQAFGKGHAVYIGACPAIAYAKEAKFVPRELKEKWPADLRRFINAEAHNSGAAQLVRLSHGVVEAGIYDADAGTALVLANFTYEPIRQLDVRVSVAKSVKSVRSVTRGPLKFTIEKLGASDALPGFSSQVQFQLDLGLNDIVVLE
jgi:hypothetical protein